MTKEYTAEELRALDARVAVLVFGWRWFYQCGYGGVKGVVLYPPVDSGWERYCEDVNALDVTGRESEYKRFHDWDRMAGSDLPTERRGVPRYTTDPAAFMALLIETRKQWRAQGRKLYWRLETCGADDSFIASIYEDAPDRFSQDVLIAEEWDNESMGGAICKCALALAALAACETYIEK